MSNIDITGLSYPLTAEYGALFEQADGFVGLSAAARRQVAATTGRYVDADTGISLDLSEAYDRTQEMSDLSPARPMDVEFVERTITTGRRADGFDVSYARLADLAAQGTDFDRFAVAELATLGASQLDYAIGAELVEANFLAGHVSDPGNLSTASTAFKRTLVTAANELVVASRKAPTHLAMNFAMAQYLTMLDEFQAAAGPEYTGISPLTIDELQGVISRWLPGVAVTVFAQKYVTKAGTATPLMADATMALYRSVEEPGASFINTYTPSFQGSGSVMNGAVGGIRVVDARGATVRNPMHSVINDTYWGVNRNGGRGQKTGWFFKDCLT